MNMVETQRTMTVTTPRFGEVSYTQADVIEFPWGLPGFPGLHRYLAIAGSPNPGFTWLTSLDDPSVALPAADPWRFFSGYDPKVPASEVALLGPGSAEELTFLCIVVLTADVTEVTMNLLAPVVIDLRTRRARQIVLDAGYSVHEPIPGLRAPNASEAQPT
jgi:flagellar assembly factor FliW